MGTVAPSTAGLGTAATYAMAWNLSTVQDIYGRSVSFGYDVVGVPAVPGGPSYTQASYLSSVVGVDGYQMRVAYGEKDAGEYPSSQRRGRRRGVQRLSAAA